MTDANDTPTPEAQAEAYAESVHPTSEFKVEFIVKDLRRQVSAHFLAGFSAGEQSARVREEVRELFVSLKEILQDSRCSRFDEYGNAAITVSGDAVKRGLELLAKFGKGG